MLQNFIIYTLGILFISFTQILISKAFDKSEQPIKIDYASIIGYAVFVGLFLSYGIHFLQLYTSNTLIVIIITTSTIASFLFFIAPIFYMFKKKNYARDFELEKQLQQRGFKYKVLISEELSSNAYATGGLPFLRLIIIAHDFKTHLKNEEVKAIIYHEIGHHEKHHIIKLFFLHTLISTCFFLLFHFLLNLNLNEIFEFVMVGLIGGLSGLTYYYLPNKLMYYFEYEADNFSAKYCGENLENALIKMDEYADGDLTIGNINHPNLKKRLNNIAKHRAHPV